MLRTMTVAGGLILGLLVAEVALRLVGFEFAFYPTKVQIGWPDPVTINKMYEPDRDLLWVTRDYPDRVDATAGDRPELVFMGCSCTQFGEYDEFFAELMRAEHPDTRFTSRNLGVGGWTSFQGLAQFNRDVIPLHPRVVTIYYGWNDHWCTFGLEDKDIRRQNLAHSPLVAAIIAKSRTVQLVDKVVFARSFQGKTAARRVSLSDFRANLTKIVHLARENGIVPVLLTAPSSHHRGEEPAYLTARWLNDLSQLVPLHESYVSVVREVARENEVDLVDLYRLFRTQPAAELKADFQGDGIHLTPAGDHWIARYLLDYFEASGLVGLL